MGDNMEKDKKNLLIGLFILLVYFASPMLIGMLVPDIIESSGSELVVRLAFYLIIAAVVIFLFWDDIVEGFKKIKKKPLNYIKQVLLGTLVLFVTILLSSFIIRNLFHIEASINNKILNEYFNVALPFMLFNQLFYTPIIEEITFRGTFKKIIKNKTLFIVVSALTFGFFQVGYNISTTQVLYMIPWTLAGLVYAINYQKSDNILTPMGVHIIYNLLYIFIAAL